MHGMETKLGLYIIGLYYTPFDTTKLLDGIS